MFSTKRVKPISISLSQSTLISLDFAKLIMDYVLGKNKTSFITLTVVISFVKEEKNQRTVKVSITALSNLFARQAVGFNCEFIIQKGVEWSPIPYRPIYVWICEKTENPIAKAFFLVCEGNLQTFTTTQEAQLEELRKKIMQTY
jgi:hypothetical protein